MRRWKATHCGDDFGVPATVPTFRIFVGCSARVSNGHAAAEAPRNLMNARRLMRLLKPKENSLPHQGEPLCITAGSGARLPVWVRSAGRLSRRASPNVRYASDSDQIHAPNERSRSANRRHYAMQQNYQLLDLLVGAGEQRGQYAEPKHAGGGKVDRWLEQVRP